MMKYFVFLGLFMAPVMARATALTDFSYFWKLDAGRSDKRCDTSLDVFYFDDSQSLNFQYSTTEANGVSGGIIENFKLGRTVRPDFDKDVFDVALSENQLQVVRWHTSSGIFGKKTKVIENVTFSLEPDFSLEILRVEKKDRTRCHYLPVYPEVMGKTVKGAELELDGKTVSTCTFDALGKCDLGKYALMVDPQKKTAQLAFNERYGSLVLERTTRLLYSSVNYTIKYVSVWAVDDLGGGETSMLTVPEVLYSIPYAERSATVGGGMAKNGVVRYVYE